MNKERLVQAIYDDKIYADLTEDEKRELMELVKMRKRFCRWL